MPILANITEFGKTPLFTTRRAEVGRRRHRALLLRRVSRDEQGRAQFLRDRAPRRHAESRRAERCRRATSSTIFSAITRTSTSSMRCSPTRKDGRVVERDARRRRARRTPAAVRAGMRWRQSSRRWSASSRCVVSGYTAYHAAPAGARAGVAVPDRRPITISITRSYVFNKGVGPAILRNAQVFVDGKPQPDWEHVLDALGMPSRTRSIFDDQFDVLTPGDRITIIKFDDEPDIARSATPHRARDDELCFCSTLGECWMYADTIFGNAPNLQALASVRRCRMARRSSNRRACAHAAMGARAGSTVCFEHHPQVSLRAIFETARCSARNQRRSM